MDAEVPLPSGRLWRNARAAHPDCGGDGGARISAAASHGSCTLTEHRASLAPPVFARVQCNYCGYERSDAEFWASLQEATASPCGSPVAADT